MEYPLEQLAIIKQKKLEEAERTLKEAKETLAKEEAKLLKSEQERDQVRLHRDSKLEQLRKELDTDTTSIKIHQIRQYLKVVEEQLKTKQLRVKEQLKQVEIAQAKVESKRQEFIKKQREVDKLKQHREEWEKEVKMVQEHKETIESDELGSAMHSRRKAEEQRQKQ